ncbi:FGGY-family carbohydrate kinase [Candidatus Nitrosacidococcus sp. I8]|uniref:FGGY-family carbohydrate kinase n=1 Tax=Candidatus Nitrosacidococcus sp. I8 TaxID=2942908 RepID=UPI002225D227|nr:FGGY-family carbohydrate kinase [Candidatus Nitrosacidococcus sp. I8]CAH9018526.1 D-ribulose kinase [Candidatus Nitrosacidococcus sp. I8]
MAEAFFVGIDLGTSGYRAIAITQEGIIVEQSYLSVSIEIAQAKEQNPIAWWEGIKQVLTHLFQTVPAHQVKSIAVNGTSGTVFLADSQGISITPALLYHHNLSKKQAQYIAQYAPLDSGALGATSGLAKLLYLQQHYPEKVKHAAYLVHQADWIAFCLGAPLGISDENNCLKTGYDPYYRAWPAWINHLPISRSLLPKVVPPGTPIGKVNQKMVSDFGLNQDTILVAGTTDSVAAVIATDAKQVGDAVTSLGSTLVLKIITSQPIFNQDQGIYSHRLGDLWLAGGASNSGGAVLQHYFSQDQIDKMTPMLKPNEPTGLNYYPLVDSGERFPTCDSDYSPRVTPRPKSDLIFFQGILEGIAQIEAQGYHQLHKFGAPFPNHIKTVGGGAKNLPWVKIREQITDTKITIAAHTEAAYGSALLARQGAFYHEH